MSKIIPFYERAYSFCIEKGFEWEINITKERKFENITSTYFFTQYVFVVLNAGMKNQIAEKIFEKFFENKLDLEIIGHKGKRAAIKEAKSKYESWFNRLKAVKDDENKVNYLETLPWIGPITKYHLARNLGIDVAKPDRHLVRLAEQFDFPDVQMMCRYISRRVEERVGVIDVVLWRYCNLQS